MTRGTLISTIGITAALMLPTPFLLAQDQPVATFKSGVDLVRLNAVVRDRKGRFVRDLTVRDFEVLDGGVPRKIAEFRAESGQISVALLFDVSGSMESRLVDARDAARHVLSWLDQQLDEAAVFTFDTRLSEVMPFTPGLKGLPRTLEAITPFGATSLHDAIGETAERLTDRPGVRRAVVVFTDGNDNASRRTPEQVSAAASAIDVPVYIVAVVSSVDDPRENPENTRTVALASDLQELARRTGGDLHISSSPAQMSIAARQVLNELRHQYVLAFEASSRAGWRSLEVRTRQARLVVRARTGYSTGGPSS